MSKSKLVMSFVDQFVALVKGDESAVVGAKVLRQRLSALNTHFYNAKGNSEEFEEKVTEAKENLVKARLNFGKVITNRDAYVVGLISANNDIAKAEQALEDHLAVIAFLEAELAM